MSILKYIQHLDNNFMFLYIYTSVVCDFLIGEHQGFMLLILCCKGYAMKQSPP